MVAAGGIKVKQPSKTDSTVQQLEQQAAGGKEIKKTNCKSGGSTVTCQKMGSPEHLSSPENAHQ